MKSNTRQVKKVDNKLTQQKKIKGKRLNNERQSSEYLRNVIYQSSSSSNDQYTSSLQSPRNKPRNSQLNSRRVNNQRDNHFEEFSYDDSHCSQGLFKDATAHKNKRLNHSSIFQLHGSKLSHQIEALEELNQTIQEPKEDQMSKFHLTETPKMISEAPKKQEKTGKNHKKNEPRNKERPQLKGFTFIKLPNTNNNNNNTQERRYPYRASREVPMLKFWQGEKMDLKRNGYWRKSN